MEYSQEEPLELDPRAQERVEGLLHLGALSTEVSFAGHTFGLRTLRVAEEIAAAKAIESFRNTLREPEAWVSAQVAMALTHVDGEEHFCDPAGPDQMAFAKARLNYVSSQWYWPTVKHLFDEYAKLLNQQIAIVEQAQDLSEGDLPISWPSADSFGTRGTFSDETSTATPS